MRNTPSVSFYLSLDSAILHYPATYKKKRREYNLLMAARAREGERHVDSNSSLTRRFFFKEEKIDGQGACVFVFLPCTERKVWLCFYYTPSVFYN
jgi:hypothetical protein